MRYLLFLLSFVCLALPVKGQTISIEGKGDTISTKTALKLNERVTIRQIHLFGNKVTRRNIVLRDMNIGEGSTVSADSLDILLDLNKKRLLNLSLFTDVAIYIDKLDDSTVDWDIKVHEQWYLLPELSFQLADRNFNVWWKEQNHDIRRANIRVALKHRNFRGNMETLSATFQIGYTRKFALEYFKPYVDKAQKHGIGVSASYSQNEETFYRTFLNKLEFVKVPRSFIIRQFEGGFSYVYRPGYAFKHLFELKYKDFDARDTIVKLNPDYYENGDSSLKMIQFLYRVEMNKVDNWNYPMTGKKLVGYAVARGGIEGMRFQSYLQVEYGDFRKWGRKWYTSNILRGRVTIPEDQPYILRNAMGTESEYLRGYEYYVIDGSQYAMLRNNLKYELLNISIRNLPLKYLPVIPLRLYPKVFADAGYVANRYPGNSFLNNRFLISWGAGVDIVSTYDFKLRLEYTWNHLGEKGLFLHVSSE